MRVWSLKQEFVTEAIKLNTIKTDFYAWIDCGFIRNDTLLEYVQHPFSKVNVLVAPRRMTFLEVYNIPDWLIYHCNRVDVPVSQQDTIFTPGGGLMIGDSDAWVDFAADFKTSLRLCNSLGYFRGYD